MRAFDAANSFEDEGFCILKGIVDETRLGWLKAETESGFFARPGSRSFDPSELVRNLIGVEGPLGKLAARLAGNTVHPVRIVFFDKTELSNWAVPWHQDRTIAVSERIEAPGFDNWNVKEGVTHVEPPIGLLSRMVTLRLHLDDCGADNGALKLIRKSHRLGRIAAAEVVHYARKQDEFVCEAASGDVLAMRLTSLHASDRSVNPTRRRVLHVDYSPDQLPHGLSWASLRGR